MGMGSHGSLHGHRHHGQEGNDDEEEQEALPEEDDEEGILQVIVDGRYTLVDVHIHHEASINDDDRVHGVTGEFCAVDWRAHKADPASSPMFRDVIHHSPHCEDTVSADLQDVLDAIAAYNDEVGEKDGDPVHVLELGGFVFHESRCGSTLVANVLQAMEPDRHRVYSESAPPINAAKTAEFLGVDTAAQILRHVINLMRRSRNADEDKVFFKIQSIGSTFLPVFTTAFPDTPWIFVYRHPEEVLVSQLAHGVRAANCVRAQAHRPTPLVRDLVERHGVSERVEDLPPEHLCAAHLAGITETAVASLDETASMGRPVNYDQLPQFLYDTLLPHHFGLTVSPDALERMQNVAGVYSKGRGQKQGEAFEGDAEEKAHQVTAAMREASETFLQESYHQLEAMVYHYS
jgi:hypothetical protein